MPLSNISCYWWI